LKDNEGYDSNTISREQQVKDPIVGGEAWIAISQGYYQVQMEI